MTIQVGYFIGSLSSTSINRVLSRALILVAPDDIEFTEIPIGNLPLYSPDYDNDYPKEARALKASIAAVDAVLFVTPEYNRSIPGALKNAIDWASRPGGQAAYGGKPVAIMGATPGRGATIRAQAALRQSLGADAFLLGKPEVLIAGAGQKFDEGGRLTDEPTIGVVKSFLSAFAAWILRFG